MIILTGSVTHWWAGQLHFDGTGLSQKTGPENAASPTSRVHAVFGDVGRVIRPIVTGSFV